MAASVADASRTGTASMTLSIPVAVSIVAPGAMWPSQIQQLTATVSNADNTAVSWAMVSGPGAINAYGVYTSPYAVSGATTATVRATSVLDPTEISHGDGDDQPVGRRGAWMGARFPSP